MLSEETLSITLNNAHIILVFFWFYGAYIFWLEVRNGKNHFSRSIFYILVVLALGSLWSISVLFGLMPSYRFTLISRLIQVVLQIATLVHLFMNNGIEPEPEKGEEQDELDK